MKKPYEAPVIEIEEFQIEDIITTSMTGMMMPLNGLWDESNVK
jgi:hypothetical protein